MEIRSSRVLQGVLRLSSLLLLTHVANAQTASLGLSPGTGSPGNVVNLTLSLASTVAQPAALQWTMSYATNDFSAIGVAVAGAASAASKSVSCNNTIPGVSTCVIYGVNSNTIANGTVATVSLTIAGSTTDTSSIILVSGGAAASLGGSAVSTSASGNTVTIQLPSTGVSISCAPDSVIPPAPSTCLVTIGTAAPTGGTPISLSDGNSTAVVLPPSFSIPQGAKQASFQVATSAVSSDTLVNIQATMGSNSATAPLWLVAPAPTGVTPDVSVSQSSTGKVTSIASPSFSSAAANELILAFVGTGPATSTVSVSSMSGAGLNWVLVQRTNTQSGTAEIWRSFASATLSNVSVTANLSKSVYASITVMSFEGVDPSGTSGAGAIGATASASSASGLPTASLTTTRDGSLVVGVGNDPTSGPVRTPGVSQNIVSQDLAIGTSTSWVQTQINRTPSSGALVTLNDLAPSTDAYNMSAVEILAPSYCIPALVPNTRSFGSGGGSTVVTVAIGTGCAWTASTNSPGWVSFNGGSGNGNGTFTLTTAANTTGQAEMGAVTVAGQSFKVMVAGTNQLFTDVTVGSQFFDYISLMYNNGITGGCNTSPLMYCPTSDLTREQMAVFMVVGLDLALGDALSYPQTPYFQDVPTTSVYFPFVQRFAQLGITGGCTSSPPDFCPTNTINQEQMAVFTIVAWMLANNLTTFTYTETPYFSDVPSTSIYFKFVQKMMDMGFWTGCGSNQYCPTDAVTRADMAPMIMRAIMGAP